MSNPKVASATHDDMANAYLQQHWHDTIFTRGKWHRYNNGLWTPIHDLKLENEIKAVMKRGFTVSTLRSVKHIIQLNRYTDESLIDANVDYINLKNGVYDLSKNKLYPHDSGQFLTTQLPFSYDPSATCPVWQGYLQTALVQPETHVHDPELAALIQEAIGYSLTVENEQHAMFWCLGQGANGKGTLFHVIEQLAGSAAVTLNIDALRTNAYQLALLPGKRVALCAEVKAGHNPIDDAIIKSIVGGDRMMVRMIRQEPLEFYPKVKLWLSMNRLPPIDDTSYGFWRRLRTIPFNRNFKDDEKDLTLKDKLDKELPGIFNWALIGLKRVHRHNRMIMPAQVEALTGTYQRESNPVLLFVEECCVRGDETLRAGAVEIFDAYKAWCYQANYKPLNRTKFKREMNSLALYDYEEAAGTRYRRVALKF